VAKSWKGESSDLYLEEQLHQALAQTARLENALAESKSQILNLQQRLQRPTQIPPQGNEDGEVINALVQEFRQPMASIMGYTDLLLAESVGIIDALQRNFLERIKGSVERLQAMSNDLIQITHLQSGPLELTPEPINAGVVIDEAMAAISSQVRAKNIVLRVDLPDELPEIKADRDAFLQIVVHLLQNASAATPVEGAISLRVRVQTGDHAEPAMLLQVSDTGGGIASEDLPRVFSLRYRADNALIHGVGDTGVGLSIAKILVEAQNGRIWVESATGQSSTFSVLLPLSPKRGTAATMS
jgi:signal transduction histidine kinase